MKPLAYRIRPTSLDDIVGQDHPSFTVVML